MLTWHHRRAAAALTLLLALLLLTRPLLAQDTDQHWLVGLGIVPFSYTLEGDRGGSRRDASIWRVGPGGEAAVLVGRGFGAWVVALEFSLQHTSSSVEEEVDIVSSASRITVESSSTRVSIGPDVRHLFGESAVRLFVEAGGGFALTAREFAELESSETAFYLHVGPGVQLELAPFASLDVLLRARGSAGWGEREPTILLTPLGGMSVGEPIDVDTRAFEVGLHARLSLWLF